MPKETIVEERLEFSFGSGPRTYTTAQYNTYLCPGWRGWRGGGRFVFALTSQTQLDDQTKKIQLTNRHGLCPTINRQPPAKWIPTGDIAKDITSTILRRSSKVVENRNILFNKMRMKHFYEWVSMCVCFLEENLGGGYCWGEMKGMKSVHTWYQNVNRTRASGQPGSLVPTWEIPKDIELSIQHVYQSEAVHEKLSRKPETSGFLICGKIQTFYDMWVCVLFLGWEFGRKVNTKEY